MNKTFKWLINQLPGIIITAFVSWLIAVITIQDTEPQFVVDGIRSVIIDRENLTGQPVKIVKMDGSEINKDLVTATFYFFNSGQKPIIGRDDIINELKIVLLDSTAEILNFKILKESHKDIGLILSKDSSNNFPRLNLNFKILEENDGFTGQITYSGKADAQIKMEGSIVGKKDINEYEFSIWEKLKIIGEVYWFMGGLALLFGITTFIMTITEYRRYHNRVTELSKLEGEISQHFEELKQNINTLDLENAIDKFNVLNGLQEKRNRFKYMANPLISMGLMTIAIFVMSAFLITRTMKRDNSNKEKEIIINTIPDKIRP